MPYTNLAIKCLDIMNEPQDGKCIRLFDTWERGIIGKNFSLIVRHLLTIKRTKNLFDIFMVSLDPYLFYLCFYAKETDYVEGRSLGENCPFFVVRVRLKKKCYYLLHQVWTCLLNWKFTPSKKALRFLGGCKKYSIYRLTWF